MPKKMFTGIAGESPTNDAVLAWLARKGIDKNDVSGYSVFCHVGEVPRIMLEMYFDDTPEKPAMAPIPEWCPDKVMCAGCPGRESGERQQCTHWPEAKEQQDPRDTSPGY